MPSKSDLSERDPQLPVGLFVFRTPSDTIVVYFDIQKGD